MTESTPSQLLKTAEGFYKQGEPAKAARVLEELLQDNPQHVDALQTLAQFELQQRRYKNSLQYYQKLIDMGAIMTLEQHLVVSGLYSRMLRFEEAEQICK